jgi:hypothetical protein
MNGSVFSLSRRQILVLAVGVEAGMGLLALGLGWFFRLPVTAWVRPDATGIVLGVVGATVLFGILLLCRRFPVGPIGRLMRFVDATVKPLFLKCRPVDLLLIALCAGVGEELLFRGLIQGGLARWWGEWPALGAASVVFGLAHCMTYGYAVFATILGLLLGWLVLVTGDLTAAIVAHAGYDFVALLILTKKGGQDEVSGLEGWD